MSTVNSPGGSGMEGAGGDTEAEQLLQQAIGRLNKRLLPLFLAVVCCCYLDRTAVAFAALQMCALDWFNPALFGLGSGIFYLGYVLFQIPSNLILTRAGPSTWLSAIVGAWGVVASCMATVSGPAGFVMLRFMLGLTEAGSFPAMWYILSLYYPDAVLTVPYSVMEAAASVSLALSAPVAAGILALSGLGGLGGWQWLFLLEGVPSIIMGAVLRWQLPNTVEAARFLLPEESLRLRQEKAVHRATDEAQMDGGPDAPVGLGTVKATLSSFHLWYLALTKVFKDVAFSTLMYWTPLLVGAISSGASLGDHAKVQKGCGSNHSNDSRTALLVTIPYVVAACTSLLLAHSSQRWQEHRLHVALPLFCAGLLTLVLPAIMKVSMVGAFVALTLIVAVSNGNNGVFNGWVAYTNPGRRTAIAMPFMNSCGNIGSLVGPALFGFIVQHTHSHAGGLVMVGLAMAGAGVMAFFYPSSSHARYQACQSDIELISGRPSSGGISDGAECVRENGHGGKGRDRDGDENGALGAVGEWPLLPAHEAERPALLPSSAHGFTRLSSWD